MNHVLIVDDDRDIRDLLQTYLEKNDLRASAVASGRQMWQRLQEKSVDLIVLDLMLPGEDGLEICRTLRVKQDIPVIILSAKGEEMDRIIGLEMGADDYLSKPFSPRELLVRIKVVLRRAQSLPKTAETPDGKRRFRFLDWELDPASRQLHSPQGLTIPLSGGETRLLTVLLEHPRRALSRDFLLELSQGREAQAFDRSIDVLIGRLRKHLAEDTKHPQIIVTERGIGYRLAASVEKI